MHDYDLVVTGGLTGLSMQLTGGFMEQYWGNVCTGVQRCAGTAVQQHTGGAGAGVSDDGLHRGTGQAVWRAAE